MVFSCKLRTEAQLVQVKMNRWSKPFGQSGVDEQNQPYMRLFPHKFKRTDDAWKQCRFIVGRVFHVGGQDLHQLRIREHFSLDHKRVDEAHRSYHTHA